MNKQFSLFDFEEINLPKKTEKKVTIHILKYN